MTENPQEINLNNSLFTAYYMPRPRIDRILDHLIRCKLVYVIAGAGYGKTQAVYNYLQKQENAVVRWIQLTESDNIGSHYWENLTHNISVDNPDLTEKLRAFGFPETPARFKQFADILKNSEHRSHKTFLVLDDFHLIHSKQALTFAESCAYLQIPGACVIIISRKEPEINAVSLFAKGKAGIITEEELRFTETETADFMKRQDILFTVSDLSKFIDATKGWALALKLLSLVLKRIPGNIDHALETMKQNIFKLLETEAFNDFTENFKKNLIRLSLISEMPLTPLREIFNDASFSQNISQLDSFIWFDSFIGDYRIHPLYMEFLRSRQDILSILSYEEKQDTYKWAAQWCRENNFYMTAVKYYAESRQFEQILEILLSYPFKLPYDACEYFLNILEEFINSLNNTEEENNRSVLLLKNLFIPLLYIGMGMYDNAKERCLAIIHKWENTNTPLSLYLLYTAYSNLTYIDTYICTATHKYNFPEYLKKAVEYYKLSSAPPVKVTGSFAVVDIRSFACLVGENANLAEINQFIEKSRETALYIGETYHKMYYGYEDLAVCEIAFLKNQLETSGNYAHQAIFKAREERQYSIEMMAQFYLLRIAIQDGDYPLTKEILKQMGSHLSNIDFWNRQLLYDLFTGYFYSQIGIPEMVPSWLISDKEEIPVAVHIPARELIVSSRYYISSKKYKQALTVLCNSYPREPQERFLFGELVLLLTLAVVKIKTGDALGAVNDFEKAYSLSFNGVFEMPFIELGRNLRPLTAAASEKSERHDCAIPEKWLKSIERKSSVYAKNAVFIMNSFKKEKNANINIRDSVQLSEREQDVLNDLYRGLSRDEIATNQYLSINTVKKILQSIYIKLDANNNVDAIRIAIEKNLIG